jgi:glutathione S-transferase
MDIILYHNPISTCSQKVRIVLAEKSLGYDGRVINWTAQEHLTEDYLKINPNGVVPSLVHGGKAIIDSSVICEYLDEVFPTPKLSPDDPAERASMRAWMRYFEEVPTASIRIPSYNKLFAKTLAAMGEAELEKMTEKMPIRKHFYRQMSSSGFTDTAYQDSLERLRKCLGRVDAALSDGRDYLMGAQYSIADIVLLPSVVRMDDLGLDEVWADLPAMAAWYQRVCDRPSFAEAFMAGSRVDPSRFALPPSDEGTGA